MLNFFFRRRIGFRAVFTSFQVFIKDTKKRRLTPVTEKLTSSIAGYTVVSNQLHKKK